MTKSTFAQTSLLLTVLFPFTNVLTAQSSLALSSGSAVAGVPIALNLALSSPTGEEPAALQWTFSYPSAAVAGFSVAAGPALLAANKSVTCAGGPGAYTCIASGGNSNV